MDEKTIGKASEATKEVAKLGSKALDTANSIGTFVYRVIGEPIEIVAGTFLTDPLKELRERRLLALKEKTEAILNDRNVTETKAVPPKIAVKALEEASLEEDENIHSMWARLLAEAMDNEGAQIDSKFVEAIKSLTPAGAELLDLFWRSRCNWLYVRELPNWPGLDRSSLLAKHGASASQIDHLIRAGLVKYPIVDAPDADGMNYDGDDMVSVDLDFKIRDFSSLRLTDFGIDFMQVVSASK